MKNEIRIFFTALMFYTRIPCPRFTDHSDNYINKASRYFPLIGWIVGIISYLIYSLSLYLFGNQMAVILSILGGVLTTGAFHEDGLADVFDGFGGGWTKEKILTIMKDSRIGAFGAIALIFSFWLKYTSLGILCLQSFDYNTVILPLCFISYHSIARLTAISIVFTAQYAREDETSKAKPIAQTFTYKEIIGAVIFGITPLLLLSYFHWQFIIVLAPLILLRTYSIHYFNKWINGYTGDCLGAVEQIAELISISSYLVICKFI
jgi:adenosylcobinamide-GDP ribazoletransferase